MVLQCKLISGIKGTQILNLYPTDCLNKLPDKEIVNIKEYEEFTISISANKNDIGYFELPELEDYKIGDDGDKFKFNTNYNVFLYNHSSYSRDSAQDVPLVPGYYTIHIRMENGEELFGYWNIIPKDVSILEWKIMRKDVEKTIKGLAMDYFTQMRNNVKVIRGDNLKDRLDDDISFIVKYEKRIKYSVERLRNEAKYRISKNYFWVPIGTKNEMDHQTMRKVGERPDKKGKIFSPRRYLEYNVAANRWLKLFLLKLIILCQEKCVYLKHVQAKITEEYESQYKFLKNWNESERQNYKKCYNNNLIYLIDTKNKVQRLYQYLSVVLDDEFLKNVSIPDNTAFPKALMLNTSYNLLYKVYRALFHKRGDFVLSNQYKHYWKKTAQLYEIWTYIQIIKSIIRLNFKPVNGWIYDKSRNSQLPFLTDGTRVEFLSKDFIINLTYNQKIPPYKKNAKASFDKPLRTVSKRDKPDIRLDIFNQNRKYVGSILLDAKYMKLGTILKRVKNKESLKEQFTSYVNDTNSPYFIGVLGDVRPVAALLVLYPSNDLDETKEESQYIGKNVRYIQLKPGIDGNRLDNILLERIEYIHNRAMEMNIG